jgi:hypothetical protein
MSSKDTRKFNPNNLRHNDISYPYQHIGDYRYRSRVFMGDSPLTPVWLIMLGVISGTGGIAIMARGFDWSGLLSGGPLLVLSILFIIGGIRSFFAMKKRKQQG